MGYTVSDALADRKKRNNQNKETGASKYTGTGSGKSGSWSVTDALKARKTQNIPSEDLYDRYRSIVDLYNGSLNNKPTYGADSDEVLKSQRDFRLQASSLYNEVDAYRSYLGDEYVDSMQDSIRQMIGGQNSFVEMAKHYGRWDSQEEYDTALRYHGYQQKYGDMYYQDIKKLLEGMEDGEEKQWLTEFAPSRKTVYDYKLDLWDLNTEKSRLEELVATYGEDPMNAISADPNNMGYSSVEEVKDRLAEIRDEIQRAQTGYDSKFTEHDFSTRYATYSQNADWEELSKGISVQSDTDSDYTIIYSLAQSSVPYDWETAEAYGYTREEFEAEEDRRRYIEGKYGVDLHSGGAEANMTLRDLMLETDPGVSREKDTFDDFRYMTPEELQVLNYISHTQGREAALAWHEGREHIYEDRAIEAITQEGQQYGYEHPVLGTLWHVAANVGSSFEQIGNLVDYAKTGELHQNRMGARASALTAGTMEKVDWEINNWDAFDFLYSTTVSGIDSYVNGMVFGPGAEVVLGLGAAAAATNDALSRGMSNKQAFWTGITSGVFEGVFEHLSLGNLRAMKEVTATSGWQIAKNIAKSMLVNAEEETATEIANIVYDLIMNGDFSQYETLVREYIANNIDPDEAKRRAATDLALQVVESGASGALMGFGFGTVGSVDSAVGIAKNSRARSKMDKAITGYDVGQISTAVRGRLTELGETGDVEVLARALAKQAAGQKLTRAEQNAIKASTYGQQVAGELDPEKIRAGEKTSEWAESIGTIRTNSAEYSRRVRVDTAEDAARMLGIGDSFVKEVRDLAKDQNEATFATEFVMAYEMVKTGASKETLLENQQLKNLTPEQRDVIWEAAKNETEEYDTEYAYADDGKTSYEGKEVQVESVAKSGGGKITLKLADGRTVDAADIVFGSDSDAVFYETMARMGVGTEDARQLAQGYETAKNKDEYTGAVAAAYRYGRQGVSFESVPGGKVFRSVSEEIRKNAHEMGLKAGRRSADAAQKKVGKIKPGIKHYKNTTMERNGVHYDDVTADLTKLNEQQTEGVRLAEFLAKAGLNVHIFQSEMVDGKFTTDNGMYYSADGSIHIDLNAGNRGQGTMAYTIAHEVTHFVRAWSPAKFRVYAEAVLEATGKTGADVSFRMDQKLLEVKQNPDYKDMTPRQQEDIAYEEVIAELSETMFTDTDVAQKIAQRIREKDQGLFAKLKEFFRDLAERLKKAYSGLRPDSAIAREGRQALRAVEALRDAFAEAFVDAAESYRGAQEQMSTANMRGGADGAVVQSDAVKALTNGDVLKSTRTEREAMPKQIMSLSSGNGTIVNSIEGLTPTKIRGLTGSGGINGYTGRAVRGHAMKGSGFTQAQIREVDRFMDTMAKFMDEAGVTYKFIGLQDVENAQLHYSYDSDGNIKSIVLSAMVKNGDYPVNFDLSSICKKRVAMSALIDKLAKRGSLDSGTVKLTPSNIFKINTALKDAGYETACLGCFVESKRYNSMKWAQSFCDKWNAAVRKVDPKATYFGYGNATFNEDSFTLDQAIKIEEAANNYIRATKTERLENAMKKYRAKDAAGEPLVVGKRITVDGVELKTFSDAARNRLAKSDAISDALKEKYLNCNVEELNLADVEFLLETGVLPGASLSNKQAITEMVKSGEAYQHLLRPSDLLTDRGISKLEALPNFHGVLYGHYGSGTPKLMQSYTPYNSEIALLPTSKNKDQTLAEYLYSIAGVRMQSFSDFQVQNIYDYLQMVADLTAKKIPAHAYTKESSFAKLLGMTGIKVNLSVMFDIDPMADKAHAGLTKLNRLVHRGEYAKVVLEDEQGKWVYNIGDYETQGRFLEAYPDQARRFLQSIGFADAVKLQTSPGYSANCGIIGVGYSDLGIFAMLSDKRVRYIIPYHASSLPADIKVATHIEIGTDYTPYQNNMKITEIRDSKGNAVKWSMKEAYKRLGSGQAVIKELNEKIREEGWVVTTKKAQNGHGSYGLYEDLQQTGDPRKTAGNFMDWCVKNNTLPLFYQFASHENYYKMLYDFNVYDCVTEEYAPQRAVTNTYPTMVDGKVVPGDVTEGGFDAGYLQKTIDKQMAFMEGQSRNLDEDLDTLAENVERGEYTLKSGRNAEVQEAATEERDDIVLFSRTRFNKTIDDIVYSDDNAPFHHRAVYMGETPDVLVSLGFAQLPMTITSKHIYTIANKEGRFTGEDDHYHSLGADGVKNLVDSVQEPIAIFVQKDKPRRVIIVTADVDSSGNPIMVSVECAGQTQYEGPKNEVLIYANPVTTAYGQKKNWYKNQITEAINDGRMLYADKKRSQESPSGLWSQCPESLWSSDFTDNIARFRSYVKRFMPKEKQIKKAWRTIKESEANDGIVLKSSRGNAPVFYSQMAKVIDGVKQEKLGAASVVSMLRGKGVKAEEIKWSGIEQFLDGKKSVTREELQNFVAGSMLQLDEGFRSAESDWALPYTDEELELLDGLHRESERIVDMIVDLWETAYGESIPLDVFFTGGSIARRIETEIINKHGGRRAYSGEHLLSEQEQAIIPVLTKLRRNEEQIAQITSEAEARSADTKTKWEDYKLPGGKNYRELTFRLPNSEYTNEAMRTHWGHDAKGIVAHARVQDFDAPEGKMLFIEEIQSDWHNEGHRQGYKDSEVKQQLDAVRKERNGFHESLRRSANQIQEDLTAFYKTKRYDNPAKAAENDLTGPGRPIFDIIQQVTNMPKELADRVKAYHNGLDRIQEYNRKISSLEQRAEHGVEDAPFRGNYHEFVLKRLIREAAEKGYNRIGWTTADIQSERWSDEYAEGYRIEYDQDIPKFLRKYGKKWGATVGKTDIQTKHLSKEQEADLVFMADILEDGDAYIRDGRGIEEVWYMDITPAMKESVLMEGQPLYSKRTGGDEKTQAALQAENAKLKEDVVRLKELVKLQGQVTGGTKFTHTSVEAAAKILMRDAGAKGNVTELVKLLDSFYAYIAKGDGLTWQGVKEAAQPAVDWLMERAEVQYADMAYYEMAMEQDLVRQVYDSYWNVSTLKTVADVKQKQINRLKGEHIRQMAEMREKHKATVDDLRKQHSEEVRSVRKQLREDADKRVADIKKRNEESREKAAERRNKAMLRGKIQNTVKRLESLLANETKKRNVKEGMKDLVTAAIASADILWMDAGSDVDLIRNGIGTPLSERESQLLNETMDILAELDGMTNSPEFEDRKKTLRGKLSRNLRSLADVLERERKRISEATVSQALDSLARAYYEMGQSQDEYIRDAFQQGRYEYLTQMSSEIQGTLARDMTADQLQEVLFAYETVLHAVRNANKMFSETIKQTRRELGEAMITEIMNSGPEVSERSKAWITANRFVWNNTKPVWAAERIGSSTFEQLMGEIFKGQYVWARDMAEAQKFQQECAKKHGADSWDMEKEMTFHSSTGREFKLNLDQIMSICAYARREQAHDHLLRGGIVFPRSTETTVEKHGIKRTMLKRSARAYGLSFDIIEEIIGKLTPAQIAYVNEMQDYLSKTMGNKGNEISRKMYGIPLFREEHYFPLMSAGEYMDRKREADFKKEQGQVSIANMGFTKPVVPKASNPVVLDGFTRVWSGHVNEMCLYHGLALPMEDYRRATGYSTANIEEEDSMSVTGAIETIHGKEAVDYFDQLYRDLNGGAVSDNRATFVAKATSKFKKAAVMLSNSVWVQQFSAIGRAGMIIDPKYFTNFAGKIDRQRVKKNWAQLRKYAPVAIIKDMGGFDTGMGRGAAEFLMAKEYSDLNGWLKGLWKDKGHRDEVLGFLPAWADQVTWCAIWDACKRETAQKYDIPVNTEKFLEKAGERFCEVVEKTQVYDSTLARSANMRSKDTGMVALTAFMAEPTTTANMVEAAIRSKDGKRIGRAMGAAAASILLNNLLASIVYAMRDDDEEETFLEKYTQAFLGGMMDDINPLTYYPILKDLWSLFQGYDIERTDMAVYSDMLDAVKQVVTLLTKDNGDMSDEELAEHNRKIQDAMLEMLIYSANAFGVPLKNVVRDTKSYFNTFSVLTNRLGNNWKSWFDSAADAITDSVPVIGLLNKETKIERLYQAIISGDDAYRERIEMTYDSESSLRSATRKALKEGDPRIAEMAEAYLNGDYDRVMDLYEEIHGEGNFVHETIKAAYESAINDLKKQRGLTEPSEFDPDEDEAEALFGADEYLSAILSGDIAQASSVKDDMLGYMDEDEFSTKVRSAVKSVYEDGEITAEEAVDLLVEYGGMTKEEATARSQEWIFKEEHDWAYSDLKEKYLARAISWEEAMEALITVGGVRADEAGDTMDSWDFEAEHGWAYSSRKSLYLKGEITRAQLYDALTGFGEKTKEEAEKYIAELDFEDQYGISWAERTYAYTEGIISANELRTALIEVGGYTKDEADTQMRGYTWLKNNPEYDLTVSEAVAYTAPIEDYGISVEQSGIKPDVFLDYREKASKCKGVDNDGDGSADSGTKKAEIMKVIDALPITKSQKDALYFLNGWAKRNLHKAPWH